MLFHVLLIEDSADDEWLAVRALRRLPVRFDVRVARNGLEALARLRGAEQDGVLPSLLLCDTNLPVVSGEEIVRCVRASAKLAHLPIIATSTSGDPGTVEAMLRAGANAFVRKSHSCLDYLGDLTEAVSVCLDLMPYAKLMPHPAATFRPAPM